MGDVRGKNDVVDAQRIARYAYKNRDEIKLYTPPRAIVDQLDNLLDVRDRLVKVRQICLTALNEQMSCEANKSLAKDTKKAINPPAFMSIKTVFSGKHLSFLII